jgi:hypothetical protein
MGLCDGTEPGGEVGPLLFDYVRLYECYWGGQGWIYFPMLVAWGCFLTYLCESLLLTAAWLCGG